MSVQLRSTSSAMRFGTAIRHGGGENGAGRIKRNGVRKVSDDMARAFTDMEAERRTKVRHALGIRVLRPIKVKPSEERMIPYISDSTIRLEMSIFGAVMNYAVKNKYVSASQRFDERPKLKTMRRDEFTADEYHKLHAVGRKWIAETARPSREPLKNSPTCVQFG